MRITGGGAPVAMRSVPASKNCERPPKSWLLASPRNGHDSNHRTLITPQLTQPPQRPNGCSSWGECGPRIAGRKPSESRQTKYFDYWPAECWWEPDTGLCVWPELVTRERCRIGQAVFGTVAQWQSAVGPVKAHCADLVGVRVLPVPQSGRLSGADPGEQSSSHPASTGT